MVQPLQRIAAVHNQAGLLANPFPLIVGVIGHDDHTIGLTQDRIGQRLTAQVKAFMSQVGT
jgi:hypothetical protein